MSEKINRKKLQQEYSEMLRALRNIQRKNDFKKTRLILNEDGSGEIQGFDLIGMSYNQVRAFKNFHEIMIILDEGSLIK